MEEYGAAMKSPWQDLPCPTCKIVPAHVQAPEQDRQDMDSLDSDMISSLFQAFYHSSGRAAGPERPEK